MFKPHFSGSFPISVQRRRNDLVSGRTHGGPDCFLLFGPNFFDAVLLITGSLKDSVTGLRAVVSSLCPSVLDVSIRGRRRGISLSRLSPVMLQSCITTAKTEETRRLFSTGCLARPDFMFLAKLNVAFDLCSDSPAFNPLNLSLSLHYVSWRQAPADLPTTPVAKMMNGLMYMNEDMMIFLSLLYIFGQE